MHTQAYIGFHAAIQDAERLFDFYDQALEVAHPSVPEETEVLKRAALILAVTAWESFLEDLLKEKFLPILQSTKTASELESAFNSAVALWLAKEKGDHHKTLITWTGDGWKHHVKAQFEKKILTLNSPGSVNCHSLFKVYLGIDLKYHWRWRGYNSETASKRLDEIIRIRGLVTHNSRRSTSRIPIKHVISRKDLVSYTNFISEIALATDKIFAKGSIL